MQSDSRELREIIRILERRLGLLTKSEMSCCGVTFAQCHALVEVGRTGSLSLNGLAEILNLDDSTVSRTVDGLVKLELLERETDPQNRRSVTIRLNQKGEELFQGIESKMEAYYAAIYNQLPIAKREQVLESLSILNDAITKIGCY